MKEQILKLRSEGKTYKQIQDLLNCSKATISYHCGKGQKEKNQVRKKKNAQNTRHKVYSKIDFFIGRNKERIYTYIKRSDIQTPYYEKIINNPYCYLTGEPIDLSESKSYNLDHIIPVSKGGDNSVENMGLLKRDVNWAKSDMTKEEFIELCKRVVLFNEHVV